MHTAKFTRASAHTHIHAHSNVHDQQNLRNFNNFGGTCAICETFE